MRCDLITNSNVLPVTRARCVRLMKPPSPDKPLPGAFSSQACTFVVPKAGKVFAVRITAPDRGDRINYTYGYKLFVDGHDSDPRDGGKVMPRFVSFLPVSAMSSLLFQ